MVYSRRDIFNILKETIIDLHPTVVDEKITHNASFWFTLQMDQLDLIELIMHMERKVGMTTDNISRLKNVSYLGDFCNQFYDILKTQYPEKTIDETPGIVKLMNRWFPSRTK